MEVTSHLAPSGGDPADSALPFHFSELLDGPQRRDEFLQELAAAAEADAITQLAVRAVIPAAGRVLLLMCRDDDSVNGMWELPTGMVGPGETLVAAVTRVVREETGLNVARVRSYLGSLDYQSESGQQVRQYSFVTEVVPTDQITLTRHEAHTWARPDEDQPVSAADQTILAEFVAGLQR
jgi:8-oxo-dGTP diphosphatase